MKFELLLWMKRNKVFLPEFIVDVLYFLSTLFCRKTKWVVIIEPGGIGDYLFVRPYFKYLKLSPKYKDCKFLYLAKDGYKDMTECYDKKYFDEIVSYKANLYENNYVYRKCLLKYLNSKKFVSLINLHHIINGKTKEWEIRQHLVEHINAKEKVLDLIDLQPDFKNQQVNIYNKIIETTEFNDFELERRRKFFEKLLEIKIPEEEKNISVKLDFKNEKYIVISMFAIEKAREYSLKNWKIIVEYLLTVIDENTYLLFTGSNGEKVKIDELVSTISKPEKCKNMAGETLISTMPIILANSLLLLSVETGGVHIAQSVGCKTICISNGSYFNLFLPYKDDKIRYVFPKGFNKFLKEQTCMKDFYCFNNKFAINDIDSSEIIKEIEKVI